MMRKFIFGCLVSGAAILIGCTKTPDAKNAKAPEAKKPEVAKADPEPSAEVKANLALLSDTDRALAEAQKYCAINRKSLLGSMGKPDKIELEGQPVFLCCSSCEKEAKADPKKTLERVAELKAKK
jgi:hypothetical protein